MKNARIRKLATLLEMMSKYNDPAMMIAAAKEATIIERELATIYGMSEAEIETAIYG